MSRKHRLLHLAILLALLVNLVAPYTDWTVTAQDASPEATSDQTMDTDGGGLTDDLDACPDIAATNDADGDGCEDIVAPADSDGDGITDDLDACPDVAATNDADGDGCEDVVDGDNDDATADLESDTTDIAPLAAGDPLIVINADQYWIDAAGTIITYEIVVTNSSDETVSNINLNGTFTVPGVVGATLTWTSPAGFSGIIPSLGSGGGAVVKATYTVTQATIDAGGLITYCIGNPDNGLCGYSEVDQEPDLGVSIVRTDQSYTEIPNDPVVIDSALVLVPFLVTVTNTGNVTLTDVTVLDTFQSTFSLYSLVCNLQPIGINVPCPAAGPMAPGDSYVVQVMATLSLPTLGSTCVDGLTNSATAQGKFGTTVIPEPTVVLHADVKCPGVNAAKTAGSVDMGVIGDPDRADPGDSANFVITITNDSSVSQSNVVVEDAPDNDGTYRSITVGTPTTSWGGPVTLNPGPGHTWTIPETILPHGVVTIPVTYSINLADIDAGKVTNCVKVTPDTGTAEDNCATVNIVQKPSIDVSKIRVTSSDGSWDTWLEDTVNGPVGGGDNVYYVVTVVNNGNVTLSQVELTDAIPVGTGLTQFGSTTSYFSCTTIAAATTTISCSARILPPGGTFTFIVGLYVESNPGGSVCTQGITNSANAESMFGDTKVSDAASVTTAVNCPSASVSKTATSNQGIVDPADRWDAGDTITYTVAVTNTGNVDLTDVSVADQFSGDNANLVWGAATTDTAGGFTKAVFDPATDKITTLKQGETVTITSTYTVTQANITAGATFENCVGVPGDPIPNVVTGTDNCAITTIEQVPAIAVDKTRLRTSLSFGDDLVNAPVSAGDYLSYGITITNTGNVPLTSVDVKDTLPAGMVFMGYDHSAGDLLISCYTIPSDNWPATTDVGCVLASPLPVGESFYLGVDMIVPAMEQGACPDNLTNSANVSGMFGQTKVSASDSVTTGVNCPGIALTKVATTNQGVKGPGDRWDVGDTITYTITIKNNGNTDLTDVSVTDEISGTVGNLLWGAATTDAAGGFTKATFDPGTDKITTLKQGETVTITATYTVTQSDIDAGSVQNCAGAAGTTASDSIPQDKTQSDNCVTTAITSVPDIVVTKTGEVAEDEDGRVDAGDTIRYTITIENIGNVTLTNIAVNDALSPPADGDLTLISISGLPDDFTPVTTTDPADIDNLVFETLPVGKTIVITVDYTATQLDIDNGEVANCAEVNTDGPQGEGSTGVVGWNCTSVDDLQQPAIDATKTAEFEKTVVAPNDRLDPGDTVVYTVKVTNTGNVTLSNVHVTDAKIGLDVTIGTLAPNESKEYTGNYVLTPDDLGHGSVENCYVATADGPDLEFGDFGIAEDDSFASDSDCLTTALKQEPAITVVKDRVTDNGQVDPNNAVSDGDRVEYRMMVTNTGNVPLTSVKLVDMLPAGTTVIGMAIAGTTYQPTCAWTPNAGSLETATGIECTLADVLPAGEILIVNVVIEVVANAPTDAVCTDGLNNIAATEGWFGQTKVEGSDNVQTAVNCPGITVVKTASPDQSAAGPEDRWDAGDTVTYTITVTNTGNTDLADVIVIDDTSGQLLNLVWGAATSDTEGGFSQETFNPASDTITTLKVGETVTITAVYTISQRDIDDGSVRNCAGAYNDVASDLTLAGSDNCVITSFDPEPGIDVSKTGTDFAEDAVVTPGDTVTFTITIANTGNVTLTNADVTDYLGYPAEGDIQIVDIAGSPDGFTPRATTIPPDIDALTFETLPVGNSIVITVAYTVTQTDIDSGLVNNCVEVITDGPQAGESLGSSGFACDSVTIPQVPAIAVDKTAELDMTVIFPDDRMDAEDTITYTVTVTNTGNVTLTDVNVTDPLIDLDETIAELAPGESREFVGTYVVTQSDLDTGNVQNCYAATGDRVNLAAPKFMQIQESEHDAIDNHCLDTPLDQVPSIDIEKTSIEATGDDDVLNDGEVITYHFTVTNTGNTTITNLVVSDQLAGLTWTTGPTIASLAAGDMVVLSATYTVTAEDAAAGMVENCADVTGVAAGGTIVTDHSCVTNNVTPNPTPEPSPSPSPEPSPSPSSAPTNAPTAAVVTGLPNTGSGNAASMVWAAAAFSIFLLGAVATGIRRHQGR